MSKPLTYSIRDLYPEKIEKTPVKPKFLEDLSLGEIEADLCARNKALQGLRVISDI